MGQIDISSEILLESIIDGIHASSEGMRRHAGRTGDIDSEAMTLMYLSVRSGLIAALRTATQTRTKREDKIAREIVSDGECRMAWGTPDPEWWPPVNPCCPVRYGYHIIYGYGDDALILCPVGRGFWQVARYLLRDDPYSVRIIAKASARSLANRWTHWTVVKGGAFR